MYFLQQVPCLKGFVTFPKTITNRELRVQTHEPVGDISCSNHSIGHMPIKIIKASLINQHYRVTTATNISFHLAYENEPFTAFLRSVLKSRMETVPILSPACVLLLGLSVYTSRTGSGGSCPQHSSLS